MLNYSSPKQYVISKNLIGERLLQLACSFLILISMGCTADSTSEDAKEAIQSDTIQTDIKAKSTALIQVEEGVHYSKVNPDLEKAGPQATVVVREFFSYGCPHCAYLEPGLKKWKADLPPYVQFTHIPASWNDSFDRLARAYYALKLLGKEQELRDTVFSELHKVKAQWKSDADVTQFVKRHGINGEAFEKTMNSFAVKQKMRMAGNAFREYELKSVPTFVVAGQYVTSVAQAGSEQQLWQTLDYLTSKVKAGKL